MVRQTFLKRYFLKLQDFFFHFVKLKYITLQGTNVKIV